MERFLDGFRALLDTRMLNPHGICLLWRPELIWTHAISDTLIGFAYFSIPLALGVFLYHRRDVRFGWAVWLFVCFIMLCGVTHFMMVATMWTPIYGVEGLVKAATATASVVTAVALWPLLPKAIAIPSSEELRERIRERDAANAELREAMAQMVRLEEHQRQLSEALERATTSETRLRSIFQNAAVGIARIALDGTFLEVNDCFCDIAGWSREELLAGGFQRITHPDDLEEDLAHLEDLLAGRADSYGMEKRYVRKDGGHQWVHLTRSVARRPDGQPDYFVAITQDIAEQKRAAEARDLLMREVDHRARNALTVVQSVVRLTDGHDPQRFKESVIGRVDSLARAQGSLARANWSGGSLDEVVRQELGGLPASQWSAGGPDVAVLAEHVQPLSMIVHELTTNAVKYGALSSATGQVAVSWTSEGPGWRLTWREAGGPAVEAPAATGFGSRLMRKLAQELHGGIDFHWRPAGLTVELTGGQRPH